MVERDYTALTQIEMIDRRVGLSLSRGERVWGRILFCGDEKLGCMVEGDYTALTQIEMINRRDDLSLSHAGEGMELNPFLW